MKVIRWILPLLALLLLAACGNRNDDMGDAVPLSSDTVYRSEYLDLNITADPRFALLGDARVDRDCVWLLSLGETVEIGYSLLRLPLDGGDIETVPYAPAEGTVPEGAEGGAHPLALFNGADGTVWMQEVTIYNYYDLPENFDPESQNMWDYRTGGGNLHSLRQIGPDGSELRRIDLTALAERLGTGAAQMYDFDGYVPGVDTPLLDAAGDRAGNLWLLTPGKLCVLDEAGEEKMCLDWDYDGGSLVPLGDGSMGAFYHPDDFRVKDTLRVADLEAKSWSGRYELDNAVEAAWGGFGEWLFLYDGGDGLYARNAEGAARLASWEETALNPALIRRCAGLEDGRIALLCLRNGEPEVVVLSEVGRDELPEVETLTFAVLNSDSVDWDRINRFNRTHAAVQIEVRDYTTRGEDGYYTTEGRDRLLTELAAGKVPDIMSLGSFASAFGALPYRQMAEKGYFEDLLPFIDSDPDLSREDLMEAPLNAAMLDGRLYLAFESVHISTFLGPERIVGDRYSWTLADLMDAFGSMPEGSTISEYCYRKRDMLFYLVDPDSYVNWETGECFFDSGQFRAVLELVNAYPSEFEWSGDQEVNDELRRRMRGGLQMLSEVVVGSFDDVQRYESAEYGFGETVAFVGHPTENGSMGSYFVPAGKLVMSSVCRNKEAAWDFIRECFLPKCNLSVEALCEADYDNHARMSIDFRFPVNRADFERKMQYETVLYTEDSLAFFEKYGIEYTQPATEEQCRRVLDFFNRVEKMRLGDDGLFAIIEEQCGPYFAGDRSLDATVDQIQRRATLYVNESR